MQADAERTLNNLRILSALSHNDKLNTLQDQFDIYSPTSMRGLLRFWYGENRAQNVQRVRQTVRAGIAFASRSLEDANAMDEAATSSSSPPTYREAEVAERSAPSTALVSAPAPMDVMRLRIDTVALHHFRMLSALGGAASGLSNLLQTYRDDAASASQISLLIEEIGDFQRVIRPHSDTLRRRCGALTVETEETEHRNPPH